MNYEVKPSQDYPGDWTAGAVADPPEGDGDIYLVIFSGPKPQERAEEYARWKNESETRLDGNLVNALL